jgi:hypothetical protein
MWTSRSRGGCVMRRPPGPCRLWLHPRCRVPTPGRSALRRPQHRHPAGADRQRHGLPPQPPGSGPRGRVRRGPVLHPPLSAPNQRQGRAVQPHLVGSGRRSGTPLTVLSAYPSARCASSHDTVSTTKSGWLMPTPIGTWRLRFKLPAAPPAHQRRSAGPPAGRRRGPPGPYGSCPDATGRCADQRKRKSQATVRRHLSGRRLVS